MASAGRASEAKAAPSAAQQRAQRRAKVYLPRETAEALAGPAAALGMTVTALARRVLIGAVAAGEVERYSR